jgi:hypothetical protein
MIVPFISVSQVQNDTIFRRDSSTIVCHITKITDDEIEFNFDKLKGRFITRENVLFYSVNGKRGSFAEKPVSIYRNDSTDVNARNEHLQMCMRRADMEFTIGTICFGAGMLFNSAAVYYNEDYRIFGPLLLCSAASGITGLVLMLDSHKWLHRARFGLAANENGTGISYKIR